jgi:hypothetical protein
VGHPALVVGMDSEAIVGLRCRFRPMYAEANMGHPSREEGFVLCSGCLSASGVLVHPQTESFYRALSRNTTRTIRTTSKNAFKTNSIGIICWSLLWGGSALATT